MDRAIENETLESIRRARRLRWLLLAGALVIGFWLLRALVTPSLAREELRLSIVERGDVMATLPDFYATSLQEGLPVIVDGRQINGQGDRGLAELRSQSIVRLLDGRIVHQGDPVAA